MRQITRCPGCATRFKVVPDQLRISHGWVRCGVCNEIFDATQHLVPAPSRASGGTTTASAAENTTKTAAQLWGEPATEVAAASALLPDKSAEPEVQAAPEDAPAATDSPRPSMPSDSAPQMPWSSQRPTTQPPGRPEQEFIQESILQELPAQQPGGAVLLDPRRELLFGDSAPLPAPAKKPKPSKKHRTEKPKHSRVERMRRKRARLATRERFAASDPPFVWPQSVLPQEETEQLSFVRQARQQQFWRRPVVRAALVLGCVLASAALALQIAQHQRDTLVAYYPALHPGLHTLCRITGCTLQARREIGAVVISNSVFWRVPSSGQYQWDLSLENHSGAAVAMPAVELTLTDARGTPLLRRVILPEEIKAPPHIAARSGWHATVPVSVQSLQAQIANYQALVFYP